MLSTTNQMARWAGITLVAAIPGCSGGDLVLPSSLPASLEAVAGDGQSGTVSTALADSLVVRVVDALGAGLAGIQVTWSASKGGSVSPATTTTDAEGRAATQRVLGDTPGAYATTATAPAAAG